MTLTDKSSREKALRICNNCGAWVRHDRARCPWCGADRDGAAVERAFFNNDDSLSPPVLTRELPTATARVAPSEEPGRSTRFWLGVFVISAIVLALALIVFGIVGVYQGLRDRDLAERQQAVTYFEQGRQLMQAGSYELAEAAFREAVRLEPDFEAARQALAAAEAAQAGTPVSEIQIPTVTPQAQQAEQLWQQGQQELAASQWEAAAVTLEQIRSLDPAFRPDELKHLLFDTHMRAAAAARDGRNFTSAIRHFDQALAIQPDAEAALQQRQLAAAYQAGLEAAEQEDWERAAIEFRRVYLIDPNYFEVAERLMSAHLRYADAFWQRSIWCEAAQQYRAALALGLNAQATQRLPLADERCQQRVLATPVPPGGGTGEIDADAPAATPTLSPYPYVLDGNIGEDFSNTCTGHSIRGLIRNRGGGPVPGVTVRAVDEWGNVYVGVSKVDPPGRYDLPINSVVTTYQVGIVAGDQPLSAIVAVHHSDRFAQQSAACHILNWLQLP